MKKALRFLLCAISVFVFHMCIYSQNVAPTSKGKVLVGGNFSGSYSATTDNADYYNATNSRSFHTLELLCKPSIGVFVANRFALGGEIVANYVNSNDLNRLGYDLGLGFSPFLKYYTPWGIFGYLSAGINDYADRQTGLSYSLGPGYAYFITNNVSIEASLLYERTEIFDNPSNDFHFLLGFQLFL